MPSISVAQEVLGITDPSNPVQSYAQAYETLTGEHFVLFDPVRRLLFSGNSIPQAAVADLSKEDQERFHTGLDLSKLIIQKEIPHSNTLFNWLSHQRIMRTNGNKADGSANALLIGAADAISARSFVSFARSEYGAGNTYIVDPVGGRDKTRHGWFVQGSGLEMPIQSASIDFVHTNQLLHQLIDPSSPSRPFRQKLLMLASEIGRVLAPGGAVVNERAHTDRKKGHAR